MMQSAATITEPVPAAAPHSADMREAVALTPRRARVLISCFCLYALVNFDLSLFGYAVPGIIREFGIGLGVIGNVLSISFMMSVVGVIVSSRLADRYGRGVVAAVLMMLSGVFVGSLGLVTSIGLLLVLRALCGGATAGLTPISDAIVVENVPARWRGIAMGVLACGYPAGWYLASLFAAPLLQDHGWRFVFLCAFGVLPFAMLFGWILIRDLGAPPGRPKTTAESAPQPGVTDQLFAPGNRRVTIGFAVLAFAFGGAYAGSAFYFPSYFIEARGYSPSAAAALIGTSYGIAVIGYLVTAAVGEFVTTRRNTYSMWMTLGALSLLLLVWGPRSPVLDMTFYALMAIFVYSTSAILPVMVSELFPARIRATGVATCVSAPMLVGFVVFPTVVPKVVAAAGWNVAFTGVIAPLLMLSGLAALLLPNRRSGAAMVEEEDAG